MLIILGLKGLRQDSGLAKEKKGLNLYCGFIKFYMVCR